MTRRFSRALCKRAINVIVDESTDGDGKRKYVEGDATLDHLAKTVVDSGGRLFELHNTEISSNSYSARPLKAFSRMPTDSELEANG